MYTAYVLGRGGRPRLAGLTLRPNRRLSFPKKALSPSGCPSRSRPRVNVYCLRFREGWAAAFGRLDVAAEASLELPEEGVVAERMPAALAAADGVQRRVVEAAGEECLPVAGALEQRRDGDQRIPACAPQTAGAG